MTNERNTNLDLIKSVACISVVGLHAVSMNNYTLYYLCDCGVPLFFMVNGYLLLSRERISFRYVFYKLAHILKIVLSWNFLIAIPVLIFRQKIINPHSVIKSRPYSHYGKNPQPQRIRQHQRLLKPQPRDLPIPLYMKIKNGKNKCRY